MYLFYYYLYNSIIKNKVYNLKKVEINNITIFYSQKKSKI